MSEAVTIEPWVEDHPTMALRFVQREGRFILQQCWIVTERADGRVHSHSEWRDVPLEVENA